VAALLAINRLCAPGSELAIAERWYPCTALDDLLSIAESRINDMRLYRCGKARRIWVFDRGIVSEENLAATRRRGGECLVGTPRSQMKQFEEELLKDDWTQVRPEVEVKKIAIAQGEETFILCRTSGRKEKEKAIRNRFSSRMEDALQRLAKTIEAGWLKDRNKMERRLGRIQASHPQVNDLYEVALRDTPRGVRLHWAIKEESQALARTAGRRLHAAHQSPSGYSRRALVSVHAVNRG
jgi:hypothetical protein